MNLTHRVFRAPGGASFLEILRDGYLRPQKLDGIRRTFLGVRTDAAPYSQMHLDWRLLLANNFEFRREWAGDIFDPRGPAGNTDGILFRGAELTEPELYNMLRQYKNHVQRPFMMPVMLTEITVTRKIDLHKYLTGVSVNNVDEISDIVPMYPNVKFYIARRDAARIRRAVPDARLVPRVKHPDTDSADEPDALLTGLL
jgi:hypothetical protein